MIRSLDDAWRWYTAVKTLAGLMDRLARRYWREDYEGKTLGETLYRDTVLKEYEAAELQHLARVVRGDLDDLSVLLLFSVFEANVRDRTLEEMDRELSVPPRHPALLHAVKEAKDAVEHGSFGRITEAYRSLDPDVRTQVDQVRKYRNWVAHGRRGEATNNIEPTATLERLDRFLRLLDVNVIGTSSLVPTVPEAPAPAAEVSRDPH